jgi:hypothetical protein
MQRSLALAASFSLWVLPALPFVSSAPAITLAAAPKVTQIDDRQIRTILTTMQTAAQKRDTNTILQYLAPNVVIDMTVQSAFGNQQQRLSRTEYRQYLEQGYAITRNYTSTIENLQVKVASNGKSAIATYTLLEEITVTMQSQPLAFKSESDASIKFELVQGKVLATSVKSISRIEPK